MGFSGKCKWFPQGTKQEKLVDTNRMRLLELRMKKEKGDFDRNEKKRKP